MATSLVVAAFDYSGGYYNPVLATSLKFGCRGHTNVEHVIVCVALFFLFKKSGK